MTRTPVQLVLYTAVILGVMYISAIRSGKSLYDTIRVTTAGIVLPVESVDRSFSFYRDVLDFDPFVDSGDGRSKLGVYLPGGQKLAFSAGEKPLGKTVTIDIKVYNAFDRLYAQLRRKSESLSLQCISDITPVGNARQFVVTDPDGNRLVFYSGRGLKVM